MSANVLITAERLAELDEKSRVIVDCRFSLADFDAGARSYAAGHIPGAVRADMENDLAGPKGEHGGRHPIPDPEVFENTMSGFGVSGDSIVVAYDDNRFAGAARLWWLLRYFGHRKIRILDGGFAAWRSAGFPVTMEVPVPGRGDFIARPDPAMTVDYTTVRGSLDEQSLLLVDSRETFRYDGVEEPIDPVAGHIPGAVNYPWTDTTDDQCHAYPEDRHVSRWRKLPADKTVVAYCGSGVTAAVNLFSMHLAGVDDAKLYAGSWSDWCSYSDSPKITRRD